MPTEHDLPAALSASDGRLCDEHDVALLDLDGVVYVGPDAVPGAPSALADARAAGMQLAFVTNNAARPPAEVAAHLTKLGIAAEPAEVITSSQAAARHLAEQLPTGSRVLVLGTTGLEVALDEQGLVPVGRDDDQVGAVVQGYSPDMNWALLAEGSVAIRRGVPWVATNLDPTVPSPRGPLPGNGSLVAALERATGVHPVVTGKPEPTMHRETLIRTGAQQPIVVGDRLDTDIEGANSVGCPSLLVFSGVTTAADLLAATPELRPTYIGADVSALLLAQPSVVHDGEAYRCGAWQVEVVTGRLRLSRSTSPRGAGTDTASADEASDPGVSGAAAGGSTGARADGFGPDALDALRALCAAAWGSGDMSDTEAGDAGDAPDAVDAPHACDDSAAGVLRALGLVQP